MIQPIVIHIQDFLQYLFWQFSLEFAPGFTLENFVGMENLISSVVKIENNVSPF